MKQSLKRHPNALWGDTSKLIGDTSELDGNCTGLYGNCSELYGDLDECDLSPESRKLRININLLVEGE